MSVSTRLLLRSLGVLNIALALIGAYWSVQEIARFVSKPISHPDAPYVSCAFFVMVAINWCFLAAIIVTAIQFLRLRTSAIVPYSAMATCLIVYFFGQGTLWLVGNGIGRSIATVGGIGDMGIAPFTCLAVLPGVYPVLSALTVLMIRRHLKAGGPGNVRVTT